MGRTRVTCSQTTAVDFELAVTHSMHGMVLSVHLPDGYSGSCFFSKKIRKPSKLLKNRSHEIGSQGGPVFCGIEWSLQFSRLHSIPQFFGFLVTLVLGHKTRSGSATLLVLPIKTRMAIIGTAARQARRCVTPAQSLLGVVK